MRSDGPWKLTFHLAEAVADLLLAVAPKLTGALDLGALRNISPSLAAAGVGGVEQRFGDMTWLAPFKTGRLRNGRRPYLLVPIEFQSTVDPNMNKRMWNYVRMQHERLAAQGAVEREGGLPWSLPVVIYNGERRWTAPGAASRLAPLPSRRVCLALAPYPSGCYELVSLEALLAEHGETLGLPERNRAAAAMRLQLATTPRQALRRLTAERALFPGSGNMAMRQVLHVWAEALLERIGGGELLPSFEELEGGTDMATLAEARLGKWLEEFEAKHVARGVRKGMARGMERGMARGMERGMARGMERGMAQGMERGVAQGMERGMALGMTVLERQAALKFGEATAARLGELLNGNPNEKRMECVGLWIMECASADDFLSRVSELED